MWNSNTTALLPSTRGDIEINEPDYEKVYYVYYQKYKDRAKERTREKYREIDNDKYDKSIREDDLYLESDLDLEEEARRQKL